MNKLERPQPYDHAPEQHLNRVTTRVHAHIDEMLYMITGGTHESKRVVLEGIARINLRYDDQPIPTAIWEPLKEQIEEIVRGVEMEVEGHDNGGLGFAIEFDNATTSILLTPNAILR